MELKNILKIVELFRGLNDAQLSQIEHIAQKRVYPAQTVIFEQESAGDCLYVIGSGQVEVKVRPNQGESFATIYLGQGQVVGEMALIDSGSRSASVIAVEDETTLFRITTEDFTTLCSTNTDIGYLMMRNLARDLSFKLRHQNSGSSTS